MCRTYAGLLALLAVFLTLSVFPECHSAAVSGRAVGRTNGPLEKIFMKEDAALNFFRRRSRRAVKSQDELNAEQRLSLAADERKREFHEGKRQEFENYAEEERDEQDERSRESIEQWREFHYDGLYPPQEYNRHST
ncbi:putative cartilage matrix-associated protein [Nelusetta ayraudi]|uniref:putative cartilage matrix-associated protein n=1 Tax=Nelusetta ayraudi TaxID=303726 RepID=UPI003F70273C